MLTLEVAHEHLFVTLTDGDQPVTDFHLVLLDELYLIQGNDV